MKITYTPQPKTIREAWFHLASDILIYAIEDIRKNKDPRKRAWAKEWLLSLDAQFLFEIVMDDTDIINIREWVLAGCPELGKKWLKKSLRRI